MRELKASFCTTVICAILLRKDLFAHALHGQSSSNVASSENTCLKHVIWEEILEDDDTEGEEPNYNNNDQSKRRLISFDDTAQTTSKARDEMRELMEPHPLRTDRFCLQIGWRQKPWSIAPEMREMIFEFNKQGHVRYLDYNSNRTLSIIGEWDVSCDTLCFRIPMAGEAKQRLVFTADVSLNPFGLQPKLLRGVILEDKLRTYGYFRFRNVLGTFSAQGIGDDMADLSYRGRKRAW
jgi:hypothetical protein